MDTTKNIAIYGAGVAGLFCALKLLEKGHQVTVFERTSKIAKKFLIAGSSGLNITHSEDHKFFVTRYGENQVFFENALSKFSNSDLIEWCKKDLDVELFTGTSGRIFPTTMTAGEFLKKWKDKLTNFKEFTLIKDAPFINFSEDHIPIVAGHRTDHFDAHIFALGGASWPSTGCNKLWAEEFIKIGVHIVPFTPMNCGFNINWPDEFKSSIENTHVKNVTVKFKEHEKRGEVMLTKYGIEGSGVYAISRELRQEIDQYRQAKLYVDLKPDLTEEQIIEKLKIPRKKNSYSNFLRKTLNLTKIELNLLKAVTTQEDYQEPKNIVKFIKNLPLTLESTTPMDEAISTSGGIAMTEINEFCQIKKYPKLFAIGEMLDWDAPTGGYLIQGCFSTAYICSNYFNN
ncbi:TIGR03862 family flavoprotein [Bacteriovorax sp. Seq25_V]|uniref:NAD(P)/FAD-dependent oxidoreductase n=1 Tax=Bacteriovorax sp. Seq25_V TaxID=1201288 RepID=UPI000389E858|nr:TIGR03862 family flavoprotein [Bacteriovorax sp. Seq25_V]EQC46216.1 hypothetical protein M900_1830 [Bacteriovorax sp. Seq25_V]